MASALPLRRMVLYKHGVGYITREGTATDREIALPFRAADVDDALKSLTIFTVGEGRIAGVRYPTPQTPEERLADVPISLRDDHSLLDVLYAARGTTIDADIAGEPSIRGRVAGVEAHPQGREYGLTLVMLLEGGVVRQIPTDRLAGIDLLDGRLVGDLGTYLDAGRAEEQRRVVIVSVDEPGRRVQISYTIPAPVWRVSYRLVQIAEERVLLQGWGIFDNRLDEDLDNIEVALVAGQPVSFRYDLTSSVIPERPFVRDEARVAIGPVEFDAARSAPPMYAMAAPQPVSPSVDSTIAADIPAGIRKQGAYARSMAAFDPDALVQASGSTATGQDLDELFEYRIGGVTVKRGESAMVPVVQRTGSYRRDLLYNGAKQPKHPVVSLRLHNDSELTLERGPVTVIEDGTYRGEAILPFTKTGGEIVLAFAVELGVTISEEEQIQTHLSGLALEGEYVQIQEYVGRQTIYFVNNGTEKEQQVTIEAPRWVGAELVATPQPDESTPEFYRWRVTCAPHAEARFSATQRRMTMRSESILHQDLGALSAYLEEQFLDRDARRALEGVLQIRQRMRDIDERLNALRFERQELAARQEQLRHNLTINAANKIEHEIRRRSAEEFVRVQDREGAIAAETEALNKERRNAEESLGRALAEL